MCMKHKNAKLLLGVEFCVFDEPACLLLLIIPPPDQAKKHAPNNDEHAKPKAMAPNSLPPSCKLVSRCARHVTSHHIRSSYTWRYRNKQHGVAGSSPRKHAHSQQRGRQNIMGTTPVHKQPQTRCGTGKWYRHMVLTHGTDMWYRHVVPTCGTDTWYLT